LRTKLQARNKKLDDFGLPQPKYEELSDLSPEETFQLDNDIEQLTQYWQNNYLKMNHQQKEIFDKIKKSIDSGETALYNINAAAGCGDIFSFSNKYTQFQKKFPIFSFFLM
jgi:hypothetical protein